MRKSVWSNVDTLSATIRQLAIDNGTPNVMPTIEQMEGVPGLASWVRKREGGVKKLSAKINMIVKPNVVPATDSVVEHRVIKGSVVYVRTKSNLYPALVMDKSDSPGGLVVLVLNKKLVRKHVIYGTTPSSKYQWCYAKDISKDLITVTT